MYPNGKISIIYQECTRKIPRKDQESTKNEHQNYQVSKSKTISRVIGKKQENIIQVPCKYLESTVKLIGKKLESTGKLPGKYLEGT